MKMKRYKCIISYDGTYFHGYQIQPNERTVQGEIQRAIDKMHKKEMPLIVASGRTDQGVHALGQVFHFDSPLQLTCERWQKALNALTPDDLYIHHVEHVSNDFHARFDARKKTYEYRIMQAYPDVFRRCYAYYFPYELDVAVMRKAANLLEGTHDFSAFCASGTSVKDKVRTIDTIEIIKERDELIFTFTGNGFLYNMVRILVGTLLEIGTKKRKIATIEEAFITQDRSLTGITAPSHGLYLKEVFYSDK